MLCCIRWRFSFMQYEYVQYNSCGLSLYRRLPKFFISFCANCTSGREDKGVRTSPIVALLCLYKELKNCTVLNYDAVFIWFWSRLLLVYSSYFCAWHFIWIRYCSLTALFLRSPLLCQLFFSCPVIHSLVLR